MTIRDTEAYLAAGWDWAHLSGCFGGRISPTDIDGFVEIKGEFLYLEAKGAGVPLKAGQQIAARRLVANTPATFVFIQGSDGVPERFEVRDCSGVRVFDNASLPALRAVVRGWTEFARKDSRRLGGEAFLTWLERHEDRLQAAIKRGKEE